MELAQPVAMHTSAQTIVALAALALSAACGQVSDRAVDGHQADIIYDARPATNPDANPDTNTTPDASPTSSEMSFFVTSVGTAGQGGNLGGLSGADARCHSLAIDVGGGGRTWHAYLSTTTESARDRIGGGPWYNAAGVLIASDVDDLHANQIANNLALTEYGEIVPRVEHDILTGSDTDGRLDTLGATCLDWSSNDPSSWAAVGHVDWDPGDSWNNAHLSQCDTAGLKASAGAGRTYCFAID